MFSFVSNSTKSLGDISRTSGVDFSEKKLTLDTKEDAQPIVDAINECPDLQYLNLTGNKLGVAAAQEIAKALEHHPELKIATFSKIFRGRKDNELSVALSALTDGMIAAGARLQSLDLSDNALGVSGVLECTKLLKSEVCSQLQELRLNKISVGGRNVATMLPSSPCRLKVFAAGHNRLTDDAAEELATVFENMGTLEEVDLHHILINHKGITALFEAFKRNPELRTLNFCYNSISPKGAVAIAHALPSLKNLKSIDFFYCDLNSKSAEVLAKAFKVNSHLLETLSLCYNRIGREACLDVVDSITATDKLKKLVLTGNPIGCALTIQKIRDKLGACVEIDNCLGEESSEEEDSENEEDTQVNESTDIVRGVTLDPADCLGEESSEEEDSENEEDTQLNESTDIVRGVTLDPADATDTDKRGLDEEETKTEDPQLNESAEIVRGVTLDPADATNTDKRSIDEEETKTEDPPLNDSTDIVKGVTLDPADATDTDKRSLDEKNSKNEDPQLNESSDIAKGVTLDSAENTQKMEDKIKSTSTRDGSETGGSTLDPEKFKAANQAFGMFVAHEMENLPAMKRHNVMCGILKLFENNSTLYE